jgi:hypothetical protein
MFLIPFIPPPPMINAQNNNVNLTSNDILIMLCIVVGAVLLGWFIGWLTCR